MDDESERWIEVDLSDLALPAPLTTLDELATAAAHLYERFVPYADEGWEWLGQPGLPGFDCWNYQLRQGTLIVSAARLRLRRVATDLPTTSETPAPHAVSTYRTHQLTERPWTGEPGSKAWRPLTVAS